MNEGLIAARYAKALFEFAQKERQPDNVYQEAENVLNVFAATKPLQQAFTNPSVSRAEKQKLLVTCAGAQPSKVFARFVELILDKKRENQFRVIMLKFTDLYREKFNIRCAQLTTAAKIDSAIENRITALLQNRLGGTIKVQQNIDKNLIGGFVLDVDSNRWDASVSGQLRKIKKELLAKK
ncbi:MAG: F0F1 ATP synthase subunit delta [Prevotellaceae bacterium]|jgi:F-type H+-transporting ATPase subunit delta|nr:F0F1 ATP synthase subunit delta [Prevotellaceae bacterium]